MNVQPGGRMVGVDAEAILRELTTRQHLGPRRPVADVVAEVVDRVGACPAAAAGAMDRLQLDGQRSIGRLRRGELIQLARGIHRLWTQSLAAEASAR